MPEKFLSRSLSVFLLILMAPSLLVAKDDRIDRLLGNDPMIRSEFDESLVEQWKEDKFALPAMPQEDDLINIDIDKGKSPYKHSIDIKNISIGQDYVVRYTIVLESTTGIRNVFYEGIYCPAGEYKTYAVASGDEFRAISKPVWKKINESHYYRFDMKKYYFCDKASNQPFKLEKIVRRIQYNDQSPGMLIE